MKKSFTLIEVMVAIFLITVGAGGAYALIQQTMGFTSVTSSKLIAAYLAQEGIEIVRNIRDTNWLEGTSWNADLACCGSFPCDCESDYTAQSLTDTYDGDFLYIDIDDVDGDGVTNVYRYINIPGPNDIQTKFKRKITISEPGTAKCPAGACLNISVLVEWRERGRTHRVTVQENLYNWK